jgi:cap1 methyltransferase
MDPTIFNIQLKNSFSKQRIPETINHSILPWYSIPLDLAKNIILHERLIEVNMETFSRDQFELINCDIDKYLQLQSLKDQFNSLQKEIFIAARNNTNPYEKLGRSVFQNRAAVKLANIDALYNLTGSFNVFSSEDSPNYVFCDIASAPGSWSEYLQFRRPNAQGYAMSIRSDDNSLNFNTKKLNMEKMKIEYGPKGPDDTGDLYTHHSYFANLVRMDNPEGVDLVMADGGFEVDGREDMQEILSSRLILTELLVAIKCLKENGKMLCKLFDSVLPITQDIIYIASLCFEKISIIKPISSRPANAERYLIGHNYRPEIGVNQIQLIEKI